MTRKSEAIEIHRSSRVTTLAIGAGIGAITGLIAASMLHRRVSQGESDNAITAGEGIKIGLLVFGLLRAIASLGDDDR